MKKVTSSSKQETENKKNEKRSAWTCWVSGVKFNHGSTSSRWRSYDHDDRTTHDREDLRDRAET